MAGLLKDTPIGLNHQLRPNGRALRALQFLRRRMIPVDYLIGVSITLDISGKYLLLKDLSDCNIYSRGLVYLFILLST